MAVAAAAAVGSLVWSYRSDLEPDPVRWKDTGEAQAEQPIQRWGRQEVTGEGPAGGRAGHGLEHPFSQSGVLIVPYRQTEPALLRPTAVGDLSGLRKQMAFPESGSRDGKNPDMLSHVHEFVKACVCPHGPAPSRPLLRQPLPTRCRGLSRAGVAVPPNPLLLQ